MSGQRDLDIVHISTAYEDKALCGSVPAALASSTGIKHSWNNPGNIAGGHDARWHEERYYTLCPGCWNHPTLPLLLLKEVAL